MPIYLYKCPRCKQVVEELREMKDRDVDLPLCGCKEAEVLISMFPDFTEMERIIAPIAGHVWKE